jgi:hypothetical protein
VGISVKDGSEKVFTPKWAVMVNGNVGKPYDGLVEGTTVVFDSTNEFHYLVQKHGAWRKMSDSIQADHSYDVYLVEEKFY